MRRKCCEPISHRQTDSRFLQFWHSEPISSTTTLTPKTRGIWRCLPFGPFNCDIQRQERRWAERNSAFSCFLKIDTRFSGKGTEFRGLRVLAITLILGSVIGLYCLYRVRSLKPTACDHSCCRRRSFFTLFSHQKRDFFTPSKTILFAMLANLLF